MKEFALLIFIKAPVPGVVKTRLLPDLTPEEAASLYRSMAEDVLEAHSESERYDTIVYFTPEDARGDIVRWLGEVGEYRCQRGEDLGERMYNAIVETLDRGYSGAAIIGTDCPHLTPGDISKAFDSLSEHEIVIGPSEDGGYYLIGARNASRDLFEGIAWGERDVFSETVIKASESNISFDVLHSTFDVDAFPDAVRLYRMLQNDKKKVHAPRSLETLEIILSNIE